MKHSAISSRKLTHAHFLSYAQLSYTGVLSNRLIQARNSNLLPPHLCIMRPQEAAPPPRRDQRKAPAARPAAAAADELEDVEAAALEILKRRRL
jgi:hypothetical protein